MKYLCKGEGLRAYSDGLKIILKSEKGDVFLIVQINVQDVKHIASLARHLVSGLEESYWDDASGDSPFTVHMRHYFFHKCSKSEAATLRSYGLKPEKE